MNKTDSYMENNNTHNYVQIHYCIRSEWKTVRFAKLKIHMNKTDSYVWNYNTHIQLCSNSLLYQIYLEYFYAQLYSESQIEIT